jgi:hypothetical protein
LKWFSNTLEELADANGNIAAEKFKEQMRQPQVAVATCRIAV